MFLVNSCLGQFSAAYSRRHPFSRSYGVILPSSLTMLRPSALGFSPHLPVSVYGTGSCDTIAAFLDNQLTHFATILRSASRLRIATRICLSDSYLACTCFFIPGCALCLCPHSSDYMRCRNFNLLSIGYAFRPRLRSRLTQGRSALPWKPRIFGRKDSHLPLATHSGILSSQLSTPPSGNASSC